MSTVMQSIESELKDTFAYEVDDSDIIYRSSFNYMIGHRVRDKSYVPTNIHFDSMFSDEKTRIVFRKVLEHIRESRAVVSFPYRCDDEFVCKFYRLTISISSAKNILFFNKLLGSDPRPNGVRWMRVQGDGSNEISLCSICNKLLFNERWQELQGLIESNVWPISEQKMPCAFTVCDHCERGIDQRIAESFKFSQS